MISYDEALRLPLDHIEPLEGETVSLIATVGRTLASDLGGQVDSPTADVSLKDGFAVHSVDIAAASLTNPVRLQLVGSVSAGSYWPGQLLPGEAIRILSGAPTLEDADAVIAEEFVRPDAGTILVTNDARPGRNILVQGSDVRCGELLAHKGDELNPPMIGLLAAAGHQELPVVRTPRVAILATGDEIVAPGKPLPQQRRSMERRKGPGRAFTG